MRSPVLLAAVCLVLCGTARGAEPPAVERYFELRDGSVLRLPIVDESWKVQVLRTDGRIESITFRLAELQHLTLAPDPAFTKKRKLLDAVGHLGADEFAEREQAQKELVQMGAAIRADLEMIQDLYTDPEIKARLREVLSQLPANDKGPRPAVPFDTFSLKDASWGDAADVGIPVRVGDQVLRLSRKDMAVMSVRPLDAAPLNAPRIAGSLRRLGPSDFPPSCLEEGFETTPDGRRLKVGENIERLFINKGFLLSSSVKTSFVSVNDFVVQGKTRGMSAATHEPLFTGEITITFVKPGNEHVPAAVTHFGCWIAWVEVNGTELHAYDLHDREIGQIATQKQGHDFLGVHSTVPIHKIRIVPNLKIDPDYTLDDFIYTAPQSPDVAHPEKFTVHFAGGDRLLCREVRLGPDGVHLEGLPAGLPDMTRPLADLERAIAPDKGDKAPPPGVFVELKDGSVLYGARPGDKGGAPDFARRPQVLKDPDRIVGLWSTKSPRMFWPDKLAPKDLPVVSTVAEGKQTSWHSIQGVKLEEESVSWMDGDKSPRVIRSYYEMEPLLLHPPTTAGGPGSWHLRTTRGEDIVLSASETPKLAGSLSRELTTAWDGKELKLSAADIGSLYRVPKP